MKIAKSQIVADNCSMNNLQDFTRAVSFAAKKHISQKRKGNDAAPYINHPLEVVNLLANVGKVEDFDVLIAAVLHDTIEDTDTSKEEITELFGEKVCGMVLEVTDDKSLSKDDRKEKQVEHAPHMSSGAKLIKLGDKISNIRDVMNTPPDGWSDERRLEYVHWGERVINGVRGTNENLEEHFDELIEKAKQKFNQKSETNAAV